MAVVRSRTDSEAQHQVGEAHQDEKGLQTQEDLGPDALRVELLRGLGNLRFAMVEVDVPLHLTHGRVRPPCVEAGEPPRLILLIVGAMERVVEVVVFRQRVVHFRHQGPMTKALYPSQGDQLQAPICQYEYFEI